MSPKGRQFLIRLMVGGVLIAAVGAVPLHLRYGWEGVVSWWTGAGISLVNCCWGTLLLIWRMQRPGNALLGAVCGGFLGRLVLAMSAFYVLAGLPGIHDIILALSIVGFYFVGMVLEIHFLVKHVLPSGLQGGNAQRGPAGK